MTALLIPHWHRMGRLFQAWAACTASEALGTAGAVVAGMPRDLLSPVRLTWDRVGTVVHAEWLLP